MDTPCVKKCKLSSSNICLGCGRTLEMIKNWLSYTDKERKTIIKKLKKID